MVGAYALAVHGLPRATGDIDLWVNPTKDNAQKTYDALLEFGMPLSETELEELSLPSLLLRMGREPRKIEVMTSVSGLVFDEAFRSKLETHVTGL